MEKDSRPRIKSHSLTAIAGCTHYIAGCGACGAENLFCTKNEEDVIFRHEKGCVGPELVWEELFQEYVDRVLELEEEKDGDAEGAITP